MNPVPVKEERTQYGWQNPGEAPLVNVVFEYPWELALVRDGIGFKRTVKREYRYDHGGSVVGARTVYSDWEELEGEWR